MELFCKHQEAYAIGGAEQTRTEEEILVLCNAPELRGECPYTKEKKARRKCQFFEKGE